MAEQRISRQELIRRQRRTGFIGRQGELASFKEVLRQRPEEAVQFLFHVRGQAGVGKSTLVRQMEGAAREAQALTAYVDESVTDAVEVMEAVSAQFSQQGLPMKAFDKRMATYLQRRHEADASAAAASQMVGEAVEPSGPTPSAASVVASQLGLVSLSMIPGVGAFTGAVDAQQVAAGVTQLKAILSTKFNNRDDVQLVLSPLEELTPVFLEDLTDIAQRRPWIALFIDTYERTGPLLDSWLRDVLLSDKYGELPVNVLAVLAGQTRLDERCWGDFADLITDLPLDVFTEAEARQLLTNKGVTDEQVVEVIFRLSGRLPVLISTLAESRPSSVAEVGDPSGTAVERFLKWETDPARRDAALTCALPQTLDEDIYRAAVDSEAESLFTWLASLPFVNYRAGQCRYHDVVRETMLRLQRQQSPSRWQEKHTQLADTFRVWRTELEKDVAPSGGWWDEERWRDYRFQELYHRLCANPRTEFRAALGVLIDAHERGVNSVRHCVRVILQAGRDADAGKLRDFGEQHLSRLEDRSTTVVECLSFLLSREELVSEDLARVYLLRAQHLGSAKKYESAVSDYSAALARDETIMRAYSGRGMTYQVMGRYTESLQDFDRAVELDPDNAAIRISRGLSHFFNRTLDDALADLNRSIELEPDNAWAHTARGITHHAAERYEDAIRDLARATEIEPDDAGTYFVRGLTYHSMKRYDDALADFGRSLDLQPDAVEFLSCRGATYGAAGRLNEALSDFDRALQLDPQSVSAYTNRGLTYRSLKRYDEALVDFDRALELDPQNASAYTNRALMYDSMKRYEDALADFNRAIDLDPEEPESFGDRALTYRSLKRHEDALVDFDRAIEISPDRASFYSNRGLTYGSLKRYEDAFADFNRAIELDPEDAGVFGNRGLIYRAVNRHEDALADFDRAIEIDPERAGLYSNRGAAYASLKRYEDALADCNRAIELDSQTAVHYTARAKLFGSMRRFSDALADLDHSIALDHRISWTYSVRGDIYEAMGRFSDALSDYDRCLEIDPHDSLVYCSRGDVYHDLARFDVALSEYERAIEVDSSNSYALHRQGLTFRLLGRNADAFAGCNRALELNPDDSEALALKGLLFRIDGRYDDALKVLDRAIAINPRSAWAYYEKSVVLYAKFHRDRNRFLMRAIKVINREPGGIEKKGNLFLSSCLVPRWQRAESHFADFMSSRPTPGVLRQLLEAVTSLAIAVPSRESSLTNFRIKIEERIGQAAGEDSYGS
ncbi:tetratricopeptide repeat protein [Streptomyces sp. NPDC005706]|uniref:tetratricopeptide repeat protein n=1 Tax=Streptomyces sp. NPDC005706 TaxID=3157169 RepID=UPI0033D73EBF